MRNDVYGVNSVRAASIFAPQILAEWESTGRLKAIRFCNFFFYFILKCLSIGVFKGSRLWIFFVF